VTAVLGRRLVAEFTGTGLLVAVVVGSGIAASRLTGDAALPLLVCSLVTAMGLAVLIVVFTPAGGAQFNPVVTGSDWWLTRRTPRSYGTGQALAVIGCQVAGAIGGAALADAMFAQPVLAASQTHRGGAGVLLGEVVATAGLLLVVVALARTGRSQPGRRYLDWDLPDPAGLAVEGVRPIRDEIRRRVAELARELAAAGGDG
jgi:glycerol uptake facilitator-like aquaporin